MNYVVKIDNKTVLKTNNHRVAFTRLKNEAKLAKKNIVGERKLSLVIKL